MDKLLVLPQKPLGFYSFFFIPPLVPRAQLSWHHNCVTSTISYTLAYLEYKAYWITYNSLEWDSALTIECPASLSLTKHNRPPQVLNCTAAPGTVLFPKHTLCLCSWGCLCLECECHSICWNLIHSINQTPTYSWRIIHMPLLLCIAFHGPQGRSNHSWLSIHVHMHTLFFFLTYASVFSTK